MFVDRKTIVHITQSDLQIQCNPFQNSSNLFFFFFKLKPDP